jgi:hypothetical protein
MPWLRGGTVAVTNGSTTVVGTNADFAANAKNGDAFVGPDGASYEIGNVASATVISIIPAYKGPTASGVAYAIMPVQGYPKALADAFSDINRQWGATLSALGTTGNYNVLPVNKGGTGGVDQVGARTGLGLGAAATEDVIPVTKGGTGGTSQAGARNGLGLGSVAVENVLPLAKGGTGGTTLSAARTALGIKSGDVRWKSNTSNVTIPNGTYSTINWTNDVYGIGGIHSQTSNSDAFVLPVGIFLVSATLTYDYHPTGRRGIRFTLSNAGFAGGFVLLPITPNGVTTVTLTIPIRITTAGTILRIQGFQDSGADMSLPLSGGSNVEIFQLGDA